MDIILSLLCILSAVSGAANDLPAWEFESPEDMKAWVPNAHLKGVCLRDGRLAAEAIDSDPYFHCRGLNIRTSPWQYIHIHLKADKPGIAEMFWSGQTEGQYGGLTENKKLRFSIRGQGDWEDILLFPFWHTEGVVGQLRFDLYANARFEIDRIGIRSWGKAVDPSVAGIWLFEGGNMEDWRIHPAIKEYFAPPVSIDPAGKDWAAIRLQSDTAKTAAFLWASDTVAGVQSQDIPLIGDGEFHTYNLHQAGLSGWKGRIVAIGIRLPADSTIRVESIRLDSDPSGPGEIAVGYFGFADGVNRAQRRRRILAQVFNRGGMAQGFRGISLAVPAGLSVVSEPSPAGHSGLEHGQTAEFVWEVIADRPGNYPVRLAFEGKGNLPRDLTIHLEFLPAVPVEKKDYVPEPKKIRTTADVMAYYFPGWDSDGKWDCIRRVAPVRKPLLGYYDESNPECVDWQIKWALENGITGFLVDWYWVQGSQQLTHWFEAYRKARYRDSLKVAIMWANHNPPKTHSAEDLRAVCRHWIDRYFSLKGYYSIDGKPAVFIWDPRAIREDLGGSDTAQKAMEQLQEMARAAGHKGITFVAMNSDFSASQIRSLHHEGYAAITTYHEWGQKIDSAITNKRFDYEDVVGGSPLSWLNKDEAAKPLAYYPLVDTGWDSRPWHGDKSMVIENRSPELFGRLLSEANTFCRDHSKSIVILGPVNEWGEGSYIEPCTEFGFEMLEAVRSVFGAGVPAEWPQNRSPADFGLGPYDYPRQPRITSWKFDEGLQGWQGLMGITDLRCYNGTMSFRTTTSDPALIVALHDIRASAIRTVTIRLRLSGGAARQAAAQLFWSQGFHSIGEGESSAFPVSIDGQWHSIELDVAAHPRWKGPITSLRFDPCDRSEIDVDIDEFSLGE